jgi:hypothetical protein
MPVIAPRLIIPKSTTSSAKASAKNDKQGNDWEGDLDPDDHSIHPNQKPPITLPIHEVLRDGKFKPFKMYA